jgi:hypothetical protein
VVPAAQLNDAVRVTCADPGKTVTLEIFDLTVTSADHNIEIPENKNIKRKNIFFIVVIFKFRSN